MPMPSPAAKTMAIAAIAARRRFHLQLMPRRPSPCDSGCPARTFVWHQRHAPSSSTSSGAPQLPQTSTDPLTDCMITAICEPCRSCELRPFAPRFRGLGRVLGGGGWAAAVVDGGQIGEAGQVERALPAVDGVRDLELQG